ncbi:MAG: glycosyltransferase family 2 protein [Bacteroidales bacterium]|nr:glycosyltransferase family 2 protein [Bacteroidales bacterium]
MGDTFMIDITIAILSHNHINTIERAIRSVLSQHITYTYRLLLFDDASTDGTQEVLKKYHEQHPEKTKLFIFDKCEGPVVRATQIYQNSHSKYLCWLDADDYWTYEYKLQKQVDFLENNPEYAGCFHDAQIVSSIGEENGTASRQSLQKYKYYSQFNHYEPDFHPYHLLMRNIIPTASLVLRLLDFDAFFNHYSFPPFSFSWAFQLYIIRNSKFHYFNECWSAYYDHSEGISKKISSEAFTLNNIRLLLWFKKDPFYKKYRNKIFLSIAREYEILAYRNGRTQLKYGFLMQHYYFKAWLLTAWWYFLNLIKQVLKS